jgi:hypothetical protein
MPLRCLQVYLLAPGGVDQGSREMDVCMTGIEYIVNTDGVRDNY